MAGNPRNIVVLSALTGGEACRRRCCNDGAVPHDLTGSVAPPGGPTCSRSGEGCGLHHHTLSLYNTEQYNIYNTVH